MRLRPLVYTAGAAAAALGVYYIWVKRCDGSKTTPEPEGPVCDQAMDPALVQPKKFPQDQEPDSLAEAEEKHREAVRVTDLLEAEMSDLMDQVETLQESVQELASLLSQMQCELGQLKKEQAEEPESDRLQQLKYNEMMEKSCESLTDLTDSLAEAEEKHRETVRVTDLLEAEMSDLTDQLETLQGQLQKMENLLSDSDQKCNELMTDYKRQQEAHSHLKIEYKKMKTLNKETTTATAIINCVRLSFGPAFL